MPRDLRHAQPTDGRAQQCVPGLSRRVLAVGRSRDVVEYLERHAPSTQVTRAHDIPAARTILRNQVFNAIVFDAVSTTDVVLRFLEELRSAHNRISALVVTDVATVESAFQAGRLGAVHYQAKPLNGLDLVIVLNRCAASAPDCDVGADPIAPCKSVRVVDPSPGFLQVGAGSSKVRETSAANRGGPARGGALTGGIAVERAHLCERIVESKTTIPELLEAVRRFRSLCGVGDFATQIANLEITRFGVSGQKCMDSRVASAVAYFESPDAHVFRIREAALARRVGASSGHFGRLLHETTGLRFREWRLGARIRRATQEIAFTNEHIGQIAFRCGWVSLSQFDRAFVGLFGISPRCWRRMTADVLLSRDSRLT
jgi:AraC-like DNA-binding protein/ActR/RegA family two-component response regulator